VARLGDGYVSDHNGLRQRAHTAVQEEHVPQRSTGADSSTNGVNKGENDVETNAEANRETTAGTSRATTPAEGTGGAGRPPVMTDVALIAGVSHQTVSRVLNEHPHVRADTRERVLDAIRQLDYRRNPSARALVTRRTLTIGVVAYDATLFGPARTVQGVERAAHEAGYATSLTTAEGMSADALWTALEQVRSRTVDGIVLVAPRYAVEDVVARLPETLPFVVVESGDPSRVRLVRVDQEQGARLATDHLLSLGHATVWHVAGPDGWNESAGRLVGWRAALTAAGAPVPEPLTGDWSPRAGYEAGLSLDPSVTAVFVGNDQMALGVLRAMRERGLDVPGDVSLVGFDDIPEAAYLSPPLTTVVQDFWTLGRSAIALLLGDRGPHARPAMSTGPGEIVVPPRLVVRASTAPRRPAASVDGR